MNIQPRFYQKECAENVYRLVCDGKRRITLLIPTGAGKTVIAGLITEKICTEYQRAVLVTENDVAASACQGMFSDIGVQKIEAMSIETCIQNSVNADLYILYTLRPTARKHMAEYLKNSNNVIVVSFGEPSFANHDFVDFSFDLDNTNAVIETAKVTESFDRLSAYYIKLGNMKPIVYATETIIDVRDIMDASKEEKQQLTNQIRKDRNELAHDMQQLSFEENTENIEELKKIIEKQKRQLQYYEQLLVSCGIPKEVLQEEFEKIEALRDELKDNFENQDGSVNEAVIAEFETAVADSVVRITKRVITLENKERYEDILKELLTPDVWLKKLSDVSRSYLITAKMNYESMLQMENKEELDYSGVCLLVTKALDVEISRRLYEDYIAHLKKIFPIPAKISKWPNSLLNRDRNDILEPKDFTLGTVMYVVGIDTEGNVKNNYVHQKYMDFAEAKLYRQELSRTDLEIRASKMVEYVEKIREDYRNPSAHRNSMNYVTAEACMDYMLETYKKLKEILEDMRN